MGRRGHDLGGPGLLPGLGFQPVLHCLAALEPVSVLEVTSQRVHTDTLSMAKSESSNHHWGGQLMLLSSF